MASATDPYNSGSNTDIIIPIDFLRRYFTWPFWSWHGCIIISHYYISHSRGSGRRDSHSNDLREKLGRRYSPHRKYSAGRDTRDRPGFHGYKHSRSPGRRRHARKKRHLDGQSDASGSHRVSDGTEEHVRDGSDVSDAYEEQLNQIKSDLKILEDQKCQLQIGLDEKIQEVESLTSRIEELELQLDKEQEESERIASRIKKFIKAHNRHRRAQEEFKRTQTRLQQLGNQLSSNALRLETNEQESSVNIVSDGEPKGDKRNPRNELNHASPSKRRLIFSLEANEGKSVISKKRKVLPVNTARLERLIWQDGPSELDHIKDMPSQTNHIKDVVQNRILIGNVIHKPLENEDNSKSVTNPSPFIGSLDKKERDGKEVDVEGLDVEVGMYSDVEIEQL